MSATRPVIDFPGYALIEAKRFYEDGDVIALPIETKNHGTLYNFYKFGSVAGYAIRNGEDPEKSLADAREQGHLIWWLNTQPTVISDNLGRTKKHYPLQMWGDTVQFHGRQFQIVSAPNRNAMLVEVQED